MATHLVLMPAVSADNEALEGECPWNSYSSQINSMVGEHPDGTNDSIVKENLVDDYCE